ncbi:hypothetical protein ACFYOF_27400 [Streptomyces sp. NPDC007148]|uniref:hypothetical protein n=1 Tax=Streptomyces sp. NPDC007148 TaxID=3364775 RepID=UPI00369821A4
MKAETGSYVLGFQVYLALPLRARSLFGERTGLVTGALFAVSALAALSGQLRLTAWAKRSLSAPQAIAYGLVLMGTAFLPLLPGLPEGVVGAAAGVVVLLISAALLAWGGALLYPFERTPWSASPATGSSRPTTGPTAPPPASRSRWATSRSGRCSTPACAGCPGQRSLPPGSRVRGW